MGFRGRKFLPDEHLPLVSLSRQELEVNVNISISKFWVLYSVTDRCLVSPGLGVSEPISLRISTEMVFGGVLVRCFL